MRRVIAAALLALVAGNGEAAPPSPPVGDGASFAQATPTAISINWRRVPGAVDYRVFRSGKQLQLVEDTQVRFHDMGLSPGREYAYVVEALDADGALLKKMSVSGKTANGDPVLTEADQVPADVVKARSLVQFGWTRNALYDSCPKWLHDSFWTFGPDNKAYPTWHPPVYEYPDGTFCTFGHEHGQDPRGSNLYATVGDIPFGYVNEQMQGKPTTQRNEDHVGHKVALFNGLRFRDGAVGSCDVYFKLHQGTHSPDALKNNTHERFLNYRCVSGGEVILEARYKSLQPFGAPNSFVGGGKPVSTSGAVPADQPAGADRRMIPDHHQMRESIIAWKGAAESIAPICPTCAGNADFQNELIAVGSSSPTYYSTFNTEVWQGGPTAGFFQNGQRVFQWEAGPYWNLQDSSRYYDPQSPSLIGRQIDLCYQEGSVIYAAMDCKLARLRSPQRMAWDDPRSPFNGTVRFNEGNFVGLLNTKPENMRPFMSVYGWPGPETANGLMQQTRSATYPVRQFFGLTGPARVNADIASWAGDLQCGSSSCFVDFQWWKLRDGRVIDAGIHAPN